MCGRFTLKTSPARIKEMFRLQRLGEWDPRYNITPSQPVLAARAIPETNEREGPLLSPPALDRSSPSPDSAPGLADVDRRNPRANPGHSQSRRGPATRIASSDPGGDRGSSSEAPHSTRYRSRESDASQRRAFAVTAAAPAVSVSTAASTL
jgi:hypothetical protein